MTHVGVGGGWLGRIEGMPPLFGMLVITDDPVVGAEQIGGEGGIETTTRSATAGFASVAPEAATVDPDSGVPPVDDVVPVTVDVGAGMIPLL